VAKNIESTRLRDLDAGAAAKTEHLEIAAYESLITTAESLGECGGGAPRLSPVSSRASARRSA
jgi:ferritin-like metal-binding protein YciE